MKNRLNDEVLLYLSQMSIRPASVCEIQTKDGISLYRILSGSQSFVLKYFENESDRREIKNYEILTSLGIKTLSLIAKTETFLLMEDVGRSDIFRLGIADDLSDPIIAMQIAKWYKQLHQKGRRFIAEFSGALYDESDVITKANIEFIKVRTGTQYEPVWSVLDNDFELIKNKISGVERTLTYNDFYYTNLIVASDKSSAFMFDYNLLGKGYVYADIRNVCSALGSDAKAAFLREYSVFDQNEIVIDRVASVLTTLFFACKRERFPAWAKDDIDQIRNGELQNAIVRLVAIA